MAIVKSVKGGIKSARYLKAAVEYVTNPENENTNKFEISDKENHLENLVSYASRKEKAAYVSAINCDVDNANEQFEITRKAFGKDNGIIAHHFVQSFSPDEKVTPELVHKLGIELAEKAFKDFQVIVATHVDRNHLHNHIIVNSCNVINGSKWHGNKSTLNAVRYLNDSISEEYGLSIISETTGLTSSTMYGKNINDPIRSKVAKDVLNCLDNTSTQEDFTAALLAKGYSVRYGKQITFSIIDSQDKKHSSFRGDTLARKYGMMFSTKAIYKKYDIKINTDVKAHNVVDEKKALEILNNKYNNLCGVVFNDKSSVLQELKKINISASDNDDYLFNHYYKVIEINKELNAIKYTRSDIKRITLYLYLHAELFQIKLKKKFKNHYKRHFYKNPKPVYYRRTADRISTRYYGNIRLSELVRMPGDNIAIKIDALDIPKFINAPFFYYVSLKDDGTTTIVFKKSDKEIFQDILGKKISVFDPNNKETTKKEHNKNRNKMLTWKNNNVPLKYKNNLTEFQLSLLRSAGVVFADFKVKDDGKKFVVDKTPRFNICYPERYEKKVYQILYPEQSLVNCNLSRQTLDRIALENNLEKSFKVISAEQYEKLIHAVDVDIPSTAYRKKDKSAYNLVYFAKDEEALRKIILSEHDLKLNYRPYREWKKSKVPLKWLDGISAEQIDSLNLVNSRIAVFQSKTNLDKYTIAFPFYEEASVMNVLDPNINLNNASYSYNEFSDYLKENNLRSRTVEISADQLSALKHCTLKNYPSCVYKTKAGTLKLMCLSSDFTEIADLLSIKLPRSESLMNKWKADGVELRWKKNLTGEQIESLKNVKCDYAAFQKKDGNVTIAYPAYSEREIFVNIYPNRNPVTCNIPYKNLKNYAQNNGRRLKSQYITPKQYELLISDKKEFMSSAFKCNDKDGYTLVFMAEDKSMIEQIISRASSKFDAIKNNDNMIYLSGLSQSQINRLKARKANCYFVDNLTIAFDMREQVYIRSIISMDYALKLKAQKIKMGLKHDLSESEAEHLLDSDVECSLQYNSATGKYTVICSADDVSKVKSELDNCQSNQPVLQI